MLSAHSGLSEIVRSCTLDLTEDARALLAWREIGRAAGRSGLDVVEHVLQFVAHRSAAEFAKARASATHALITQSLHREPEDRGGLMLIEHGERREILPPRLGVSRHRHHLRTGVVSGPKSPKAESSQS